MDFKKMYFPDTGQTEISGIPTNTNPNTYDKVMVFDSATDNIEKEDLDTIKNIFDLENYSVAITNYNVLATDKIIDCTTGTFTVNLPTAVGITGKEYKIINSGTGIITVACYGGENISGEATRIIAIQHNELSVVSDGANWQIVGSYIEPYVAHGTYTDNTTQTITSTSVPWAVRFDTTEDQLGIVKGKTGTVTIDIANPAVIHWTGHGLFVDSPVVFTTTIALPTGITAGTIYYVISAGFNANQFQISTTPQGAAVVTSGTQSGVHTATNTSVFCHNSPGDYEYIFSALGDVTTGNGHTIDIWFRKNGSPIARSNTRVQIATATNVVVNIAPFITDVSSGDCIELFWVGSSTACQLLYISNQINPIRPATPSVILTIKKISR